MRTDNTSPQHEEFLTWDMIVQDCQALAQKLKNLNTEWQGIIAVTRGGLIPAALVARALKIKVIETVGLSSYDDDTHTQRRIQIMKDLPPLAHDGDGWLVIDDLADIGATAAHIRKTIPKATVATVYAKPAGAKYVDYFAIEKDQHVWLHFPWED